MKFMVLGNVEFIKNKERAAPPPRPPGGRGELEGVDWKGKR